MENKYSWEEGTIQQLKREIERCSLKIDECDKSPIVDLDQLSRTIIREFWKSKLSNYTSELYKTLSWHIPASALEELRAKLINEDSI